MPRTSLLIILCLFPAAVAAQPSVGQFVGRPVQDVSIFIEKTPTDSEDRPKTPVQMLRITVDGA